MVKIMEVSNDVIGMLPHKLRGTASLYRIAGIIGTLLSMASIWIILCLVAIIYFMAGAPFYINTTSSVSRFGYILSQVYFNKNSKFQSCASVNAGIFFVMNWIYMFILIHLLVASKIAFCELRSWRYALLVRERTLYWVIASGIMIMYEGVVGLFFLRDYFACSHNLGAIDKNKMDITGFESKQDASDQDTAAAAMTLTTLVTKGFLMWMFNLSLTLVVLIAQYVRCPVPDE